MSSCFIQNSTASSMLSNWLVRMAKASLVFPILSEINLKKTGMVSNKSHNLFTKNKKSRVTMNTKTVFIII